MWPPVRFLREDTFLKGGRVLKTANRTVDFFPFQVLYPSHTRPKWRKKATLSGAGKPLFGVLTTYPKT